MKRLVYIIFVLTCCLISAQAQTSGSCGDNLYWTLQDSTLIITGSGAMYDYYSSENIPWNDLRSSIKNVSLPNGMTSIAFSSFYECINLRSITIPNSVTNIYTNNPFNFCPSLISIEVMSGNTTYDSREGCNAIIETATNTLIIGCQNTTIPQSVTSIGNYAFEGCSNLNSINIHKNILSIGIHSFGNCYAVTSIIVEDGNAVYDSREGCNAIIETATNTLITGCQTTVIPSTITTIGDYAFSNRTSNNPIVIPNGVTTINEGAFWCCRFESITIPESVTSIGDYAFYLCSSLTSVTIEATTPPTLGDAVFTSSPTCYIPVGTLAAYQASDWASQVGSFVEQEEVILTCVEAVEMCTSTTPTSEAYTIRGYVTQIVYEYSSSNNDVTFWIADEIDGGQVLYVYRAHPISTIDQAVKVGDYIEIVGSLQLYNNIPEVAPSGSYTILNAAAGNLCGANLYWEYDGGTLTIKGEGAMYDYTRSSAPWNSYLENITAITLPSGITTIGNYAFSDMTNLSKISLPSSLLSIGKNAFYHCASLSSITIPANVDTIVPFAFAGCSALTSIRVNAKNTTYDSRNSCNAVIHTATNTLAVGCQNTVIPADVVKIGDAAFERATFSYIEIPNTVTEIAQYAFYGCEYLTTIDLPDNLTTLGYAAFRHCYALNEVVIPSTVTQVEGSTFSGCTSLTSIVVESGNTKYDSRNSCNAIIETATNTLIAGCQNTVIPNNVTSIGSQAFYQCSSLTSITIPNNVTSIGIQAFSSCSSLTSVTVEATTPPTLGTYVFSSSPTCYIPAGTLSAYQASDWAQYVGSFVEQGSTTTPASDFHNFEDASLNAEWQFIQSGQTNYWTIGTAAGSASTGSNALYITNDGSSYAYTVTSSSVSWAYIPVTLETNETISFKWKGTAESCCDYLAVYLMPVGSLPTAGSTNLPDGTITLTGNLNQQSEWQTFSTTINAGEYNLCFMWRNDGSVGNTPIAVDDVTIGENTSSTPAEGQCGDNLYWSYANGTLSITGSGAMYDFSDDEVPWKDFRGTITTVSLPQGLTTIGTYAFAHCRVLSSITLPNTVTIIGDYAFYDCDALINMVIPESVTTIGNNAFLYCDGLTNVTLPSGITAVEDNAFASCPSLTTITIPNGVTTIGNYAFYDCDALTTVNMPNTLITIGNYAFANCDVLSGITIPNSVTTIGNNAFYSCSVLTSIHVEATTPPTIGSNLFSSAPTCYIPCGTLAAYQASDWASQVGSFEEECAGMGEPVEMTGVVKRALQMGENVVVLTHETDGTAHIYNIVGGFAYEISQQGVIARDPENAGDYLAISDIALTEDGKLVACNYVRCQYSADQVDVGYKRGTNYFYMWDTLASDPHVWFTAQDAANSYRSDAGYTFAVNGASQDCQVLVSKRHYSATSGGGALRLSCYTVIDGTISHIYYGYSISASDNPPMDASRDGENIQFTLSPRGEKKDFIFDAEKVTPMEFRLPEGQNQDVIIVGQTSTDLLNVKFNGSTYFNYAGYSLMTAPKTDADGKVIGVQVLNITDGLDAATEVVTANLNVAIEATAIATAVNVVNDRLVITLVADATIYILNVELQIESDAITYELNGGVTNDYGWMTKNDMFQACMADCGVTDLPSLDEIKALADPFTTICGKLTDVTRMLNAEKWDWLETYIMSVQNADASATALTEGTTSAAWRYALAAFFLETKRTSWPVSADFSQAGTVQAFMPVWQHGFSNPTNPTASFTLNAPYKEGYTFDGWYAASDFSGDKVTTVDATTTGTLYAKWVDYIPTIAEVKALTDDTETKVAGVVNFISGKNVYIQDATGGILLYTTEYPTCTVGQRIVAKGVKVIYGGAPELSRAAVESAEDGELSPATSFADLAALVGDTEFMYFGTRVTVSGLQIASYDSYNNPTVADALGNQALCYKMVLDPVAYPVGTKVTVNAVAAWYNGFHFVGDVAGIEFLDISITDTTICYGETYTWEVNGTAYSESGTYTYSDSWTGETTAILNLTVSPAPVMDIDNVTINENELPYIWDGYTINAAGGYTYTEESVHGCDSVIHELYLTVESSSSGSTSVDYCDFESSDINAQWQFIQYGQTNHWTIGTAAGSASAGSNALYITNDGYNYSYTNNYVSVSWAYIPVELETSDTISFYWKGTAESSYDHIRVYLYPENSLPTAGSSTASNDAVQVTSTYLCGQSSWQYFTATPGVAGRYNLCFMWKNDASSGSMPIAVDEIRISQMTVPALPENQCGENLYWAYNNGTLTISGSGAMYDSHELLSYRQQSWFPDAVTAVSLPRGLTHIGATAFADCSNLTSITIPSTVTSIGAEAFAWSGLERITLPESVQDIAEMAFVKCGKMTKFVWRGTPATLGNVYNHMFLGCNQLDTVIAPARMWECTSANADIHSYYGFPSHIRYVEVTSGELSSNAISYIASSYESLTTLDISAVSNATLPTQAFASWTALETLHLPVNLTVIPYQMVYGCTNLSTISIPNYVQEFGNEAFSGCVKLHSIDFADGQNLLSIGQYAFYNCSTLVSVTVPEGVQTLGAYAFYNNASLVKIKLPSTLNVIGNYAFGNCQQLMKMNVAAYAPPTVSSNTFYSVPRTATVYVPESAINTYKSTYIWNEFFIESNVQDALDNIFTDSEEQVQKLLIHGQVFIIRNGKCYDLMGQEVETEM